MPALVTSQAQSYHASLAEINVTVKDIHQATVSASYPVTNPTAARTLKLTYLLPQGTSVANLHVVYGGREHHFIQQPSGPWVRLLFNNRAVPASEFRVLYDVDAHSV